MKSNAFVLASVMLCLSWALSIRAETPAARTGYEDLSDTTVWSSLGRGAEWKVVSSTEVHETDPDEPWKNNGYFRMFEQAGTITYEVEVQVPGAKGGAGMFVMGQNPQAVEHGDSYLIYFSAGTEVEGKKGALHIAKFVNDKPVSSWSPKFALPAKSGEWVSLKILYDASKGEFVVSAGDKEIGHAKDPTPIRKGNHVCLHSFGTSAKFRHVRMRKQ